MGDKKFDVNKMTSEQVKDFERGRKDGESGRIPTFAEIAHEAIGLTEKSEAYKAG